jgi:threonylcarbamoyladenosine tRNA methylthiotransferase MtaB
LKNISKTIVSSLTFLPFSLGCRTNQAEIEELSQQLINLGLKQAQIRQTPDLVLLNTCVVTQKAEKETKGKIREIKKKYPKAYLVVLGCGVTAKEKFKLILPQADLFITNQDKDSTINLLKDKFKLKNKINQYGLNNKYTLSGRKFLKIQDGCQNLCSFCLTCLVRGNPTILSINEIVNQINFWESLGVVEIILTGINLGLYPNIEKLLKEIQEKTKIARISFSSIYPEMLTDTFLTTVINNPRFSQSFHLSLQSGSHTVLQRMNRKTNPDQLVKKLNKIKKQNPFFTLRADLIIGFPQETNEEFKQTLAFIKKAQISFGHVFTYSPRKNTSAFNLTDLPKEIKKQRAEIVKKEIEKIRKTEFKKMLNQVFPCLVVKKKETFWEALSQNNYPVLIQAKNQNLKGKIVKARIVGLNQDRLLGEIIS